jgi:hypothetical protein
VWLVTEAGVVKIGNGYHQIAILPDGSFLLANINTKNLTKSKTYVYRISLNDGSTIDFMFGLK